MRIWSILLFALFIHSCSTKDETIDNNLVVENLKFFEKYHYHCEQWLELNNPCSQDSCMSSAAVEIVGIDTTDQQNILVYTWAWNEHFLIKDNQAYSGNKKLTIARFTLDGSSRELKISDVYTPDENAPLLEQLTEENVPQKLIQTYFAKQSSGVEKIRIQALSKKAKDKFNLYLLSNQIELTEEE